MYKVFINEKVICFTNNQESLNKSTDLLKLSFFSNSLIPYIYKLMVSDNRISVIIVVDDPKLAFSEF